MWSPITDTVSKWVNRLLREVPHFFAVVFQNRLCEKQNWTKWHRKATSRPFIWEKHFKPLRPVCAKPECGLNVAVPPYPQGIHSQTPQWMPGTAGSDHTRLYFNSAETWQQLLHQQTWPLVTFVFFRPDLLMARCHSFQGIPWWRLRTGSALSGVTLPWLGTRFLSMSSIRRFNTLSILAKNSLTVAVTITVWGVTAKPAQISFSFTILQI